MSLYWVKSWKNDLLSSLNFQQLNATQKGFYSLLRDYVRDDEWCGGLCYPNGNPITVEKFAKIIKGKPYLVAQYFEALKQVGMVYVDKNGILCLRKYATKVIMRESKCKKCSSYLQGDCIYIGDNPNLPLQLHCIDNATKPPQLGNKVATESPQLSPDSATGLPQECNNTATTLPQLAPQPIDKPNPSTEENGQAEQEAEAEQTKKVDIEHSKEQDETLERRNFMADDEFNSYRLLKGFGLPNKSSQKFALLLPADKIRDIVQRATNGKIENPKGYATEALKSEIEQMKANGTL